MRWDWMGWDGIGWSMGCTGRTVPGQTVIGSDRCGMNVPVEQMVRGRNVNGAGGERSRTANSVVANGPRERTLWGRAV